MARLAIAMPISILTNIAFIYVAHSKISNRSHCKTIKPKFPSPHSRNLHRHTL
jgi:hypothetical protein